MSYRKKLIEVALPLEAINRESAREKSIRHGHPSTLHLWWARRPLAACRAVLFASIVDDPSSRPEEFPTEEDQEAERQRLFRIIEELVKWENTNDETVLEAARAEILKATDGKPPTVLDPFCGGGSIPLEAQRLGLAVLASDLNPVAVLITKALVELPPRFAGQPPVNPESRAKIGHDGDWRGAQGLAEDVRYYGRWMRDKAERRIGHLYPTATLPDGGDATVIAWLWARTVGCPNPACGVAMPLVRSFRLSTKKGKQAWVEPVIDRKKGQIHFEVRNGEGSAPSGTVDRRGARCLVCESPVALAHIRTEAKHGRMRSRLMAIVAEGQRRRTYLSPIPEHEAIPVQPQPQGVPETDLPERALGFRVQGYGMTKHRDLFTPRQLVAVTTLSDLVSEARARAIADGAEVAYADAIATNLALSVDRTADYSSTICTWHSGRDTIRNTFARPAVPMTWDFAEANPFSESTGNYVGAVNWTAAALERVPANPPASVKQLDARESTDGALDQLVCTDPPYYDNIGYADLSDFFYIWLRRSLQRIYRNLFSTLLTPKTQELVASPDRFGGDQRDADRFFETGLAKAFEQIRGTQHSNYPQAVFYAFKQAESDDGAGSIVSTGWETMLEGLLRSGLAIVGTWPMRSELGNRPRSLDSNALASSIVLICRQQPADAALATRGEFLAELRNELPGALRMLQHGSIAPVDLAQAAIGPGMAVFSRYAKVVEASGEAMSVRAALGLINEVLDEVLTEQEGEYDRDTRFAVAWFEQHGMEEGQYGEADVLSRAKDTSVSGMVEAGILASRSGKVRLLRRDELEEGWDPTTDRRLTVWEVAQHLMQTLGEAGEQGAADLLRRVGGSLGEIARDLAYRLFTACERKGWAQEALAYNALAAAWPEIVKLAGQAPAAVQTEIEV